MKSEGRWATREETKVYKEKGLFLMVSELTWKGRGGVGMLRRGGGGEGGEEEEKTDLLDRFAPAQRVRQVPPPSPLHAKPGALPNARLEAMIRHHVISDALFWGRMVINVQLGGNFY